MSGWAVLIPPERSAAERLFHHDTLELTGLDGADRPSPGDQVLVVDEDRGRQVVALGRVSQVGSRVERDPDDPLADDDADRLVVSYVRRAFDEPVPADQLVLRGPVTPLDPATFGALASRIGPPRDRSTWLVSLSLPIEATTAAEAVRLFWSYVMELGPRELPAYVSPAGNELAMQTFVLGTPANQDPEEDED